MKKLFLSTLFGSLVFASATFGKNAVDECFDLIKAGDYQRAIQAGQRAVNMFPNNFYANLCLGAGYYRVGELKLAVDYLKKAESLTSDKGWLSATYNLLGRTLYRMGDLDNALYYHNKHLALSRELGEREGEAVALNNIAMIYKDKGDYDKALEYFQQALKLSEDDEQRATAYNNIAIIYSDKGDYNKAIEYLQKAIELGERVGDYHGVAQTYLNLGDTYREAKNYELAEKYLTEGLKRVQKVGDKYWEAYGYAYLGRLYRDKGDINLAVDYLKRAYNLFKSIGAQADAKEVKEALLKLGVDPDKPQSGGKRKK